MPTLSSALDPRSVIVLAGVMGLLMSLVMFSMRRSYPSSIRGLREWTLAPLMCFGSTVLFAMRGVLPDVLTIPLANMVLFQGCITYYAGSQLFLGHERDTRGWSIVTLVLGAVLFWYSQFQPDYTMRLAVFTVTISVLFAFHAQLYLRHRLSHLGMRVMTGLLLLQATVAGLRFVTVLFGAAGSDLLQPSWLQVIYIVMYSFTALLMSIAGVLMATDRVRIEFEFLASHDPLTGVLNRRALFAQGEKAFARSRRGEAPMALLMLDADHFKRINDAFGHQTGDEVLRELAQRLQEPLPAAARLGRYGGEEFLAVLPGLAPDAAHALAERLREGLARPFEAGSPLAGVGIDRLTVSIGMAAFQGPGDTLDAMLARADAALYRAKAAGRNRVEVA
ncbi:MULTISPECIES: GGDEF domain-containing protein [unclassified Variovorax]|uniref:GGDEF domain-containing protein n=1 Tax=unclassified Variovorax TaxID=663243 RepID=UPI00257861D5|nr:MULTISPECIES: GGDEF domain-containing protein [unclassified Variovorax]MDM0088640.1 GGDEF domain-containing protein [Variovorax sp. J22G40]MDM0146713.1 GGDEF domain-containing protein [Variovorax sp. J2P1-31]